MNKRIVWVDYVKVICIYLMIACHVDQRSFNPVWIYSFHMPAFFIVSGLLFKARPIWKEIKSFAIPVLFCSVINIGFNLLCMIKAYGFEVDNFLPGGDIYCKLIDWGYSFLISREGELFPGIWFIVSLLAMRILFSFSWCKRNAYIIAFFCCLWMMISPYLIRDNAIQEYHLYHVFATVPFFVAGFWIKDHPAVFQKALNCRFEIKLALIIIFVCVCGFQGFCAIYEYEFGYNYIIYMINALVGSFLLISFCRYLPERKYIINLSCGTFLLLGLHRTISACNMVVIFGPMELEGQYVPLLNAALIMLWCYMPIRWMLKKCPILLGK